MQIQIIIFEIYIFLTLDINVYLLIRPRIKAMNYIHSKPLQKYDI